MKLRHTEIGLPAGSAWLDGLLAHAPDVDALVLMTERSGANLRTARSAHLAAMLESRQIATLRVGLLSHDEERRAADTWNNVAVLAARIGALLAWLGHQPTLRELPFAIIGKETAVAAAIKALQKPPAKLRTLVSRSGRPDRAGLEPLRELSVPFLMVAGGDDPEVLQPNRLVYDQLVCTKELFVVEGASRNFEEPGSFDQACRHIAEWLLRWLRVPGDSP